MRPLVALLALALLMAGCSDEPEHDHTYMCQDGTEVDYAEEAGHHNGSFDAGSLCLQPVKVLLTGMPATLAAYQTTTIGWDADLGGRDAVHSMDNHIRMSTESADPGPADAPDAYGIEIARWQHQDLPQSFEAPLMVTQPGTYYLRATAQIAGETVWSQEHLLQVTSVEATGTTHTVTHGAGDFLGGIDPTTVDATLGDALAIQNDDLVAHTFTFESGPMGGTTIAVDAQSTSAPVLLDVPGTSQMTSDDQMPITVTVNVAAA